MKAIILAAGVGNRLAVVTRHRPKCLVEFEGRSLLVRYLDALLDTGIKNVVIVVGHKQEMIRAAVGDRYRGMTVAYVVNDQYHRGSLYSLWLARQHFNDDLLIMDADVLCPAAFVKRLVHSPHPNAILIDDKVRQESEERMAVARDGRLVALTKKPPEEPADIIGEGVGFLKLTRGDTKFMLDAMAPFVERGDLDMEYEDTWDAFFRTVSVGYESVGGEPWIEIDFPEDIERATREILPILKERA
jgi:choline kinase